MKKDFPDELRRKILMKHMLRQSKASNSGCIGTDEVYQQQAQ
jgi:hypothetical protein